MLTSWTAGAFLLFGDPKIKVFMDARDQSFYSDEIIELYFSIMNSRREDIPRTLEVLDRYQVSFAVLATKVGDFDLATLLMETGSGSASIKTTNSCSLPDLTPKNLDQAPDHPL